jgi:hypothetical protein
MNPVGSRNSSSIDSAKSMAISKSSGSTVMPEFSKRID